MIRLPLKAEQNTAKIGEAVMAVLDSEAPGAKLSRVEFVGPQVAQGTRRERGFGAAPGHPGDRSTWRYASNGASRSRPSSPTCTTSSSSWAFSPSSSGNSRSVLAAVLAVLGYSVNESVAVFDRVRETFKKVQWTDHAAGTRPRHHQRTISRTIITHGSTQLMVLSMLIFGGETRTTSPSP